MTVELGTALSPYRCRHTSFDYITWRVNGSSLLHFPDIIPRAINEDGNTVYTLTIPAEPQYNGTVVECVAYFFDGSPPGVSRSPPATLFFIPTDSLPDTTHFETAPTNIPPGRSHENDITF